MWNNTLNVVLIALFVNLNSWGQKKTVDTVYVYEEIIIHDTIYVNKPTEDWLKSVKVVWDPVVQQSRLSHPDVVSKQPIWVPTTLPDWAQVEPNKKPQAPAAKRWGFDLMVFGHHQSVSLFSDTPPFAGWGLGIQAWYRGAKKFPYWASVGAEWALFQSGYTLQAQQTDSPLNGYYFYGTNPYRFDQVQAAHSQWRFPLRMGMYWRSLFPFVSVAYGISTFEAQMTRSSGTVPLTFDESVNLSLRYAQLAYGVGFFWQCNAQWKLGLQYQYLHSGAVAFQWQGSDLFIARRAIEEKQWSLMAAVKIF